MEAASRGVRDILRGFMKASSPEVALLKFVRQLEDDYAESQDIALFIFGMRSFFCWPDATLIAEHPESVERIQGAWLIQNEEDYTRWLVSAEDNPERLKWAKWTFQAKTSILSEFVKGCGSGAA